jgi:hypothetical protein
VIKALAKLWHFGNIVGEYYTFGSSEPFGFARWFVVDVLFFSQHFEEGRDCGHFGISVVFFLLFSS